MAGRNAQLTRILCSLEMTRAVQFGLSGSRIRKPSSLFRIRWWTSGAAQGSSESSSEYPSRLLLLECLLTRPVVCIVGRIAPLILYITLPSVVPAAAAIVLERRACRYRPASQWALTNPSNAIGWVASMHLGARTSASSGNLTQHLQPFGDADWPA